MSSPLLRPRPLPRPTIKLIHKNHKIRSTSACYHKPHPSQMSPSSPLYSFIRSPLQIFFPTKKDFTTNFKSCKAQPDSDQPLHLTPHCLQFDQQKPRSSSPIPYLLQRDESPVEESPFASNSHADENPIVSHSNFTIYVFSLLTPSHSSSTNTPIVPLIKLVYQAASSPLNSIVITDPS